MVKRSALIAISIMLVVSGCVIKDKVLMDIPIEEMDALEDEFIGRTAWTRAILIDLGPDAHIVQRDEKVKILDLDMHWNGAVKVERSDRHTIRHGLKLKRPVTKESFELEMRKLFWFEKPTYRYRMNLRKYGKKTAKAIFNHELFKGMRREAALESWGYPDEMNSNEVGGVLQEQWIYINPQNTKEKQYIVLLDGIVDSWEE